MHACSCFLIVWSSGGSLAARIAGGGDTVLVVQELLAKGTGKLGLLEPCMWRPIES